MNTQYKLCIYEPNSHQLAATYLANRPFGPLQPGDLIETDGKLGFYSLRRRLRVVEIKHSLKLVRPEKCLRHLVTVYTQAAPPLD